MTVHSIDGLFTELLDGETGQSHYQGITHGPRVVVADGAVGDTDYMVVYCNNTFILRCIVLTLYCTVLYRYLLYCTVLY